MMPVYKSARRRLILSFSSASLFELAVNWPRHRSASEHAAIAVDDAWTTHCLTQEQTMKVTKVVARERDSRQNRFAGAKIPGVHGRAITVTSLRLQRTNKERSRYGYCAMTLKRARGINTSYENWRNII